MKTQYEEIYDFRNLYDCHINCRRSKRHKPEVIMSYHGHLQHGHSYEFRKKLSREIVFTKN